jgi:hypothetical protein
MRRCTEAGCVNPARGGRCSECRRKVARAKGPRPYDRKSYKIARRRQLFNEPLCEFELEDGTTCSRIAEHTHHIEHLADGGAPFAISNLMSICAEHHAEIHRQEGRAA